MKGKKKDIEKRYFQLYPGQKEALENLYAMMEAQYKTRSKAYIKRDELKTDWVHSANTIGMMLYVDLFSETLENLMNHMNYFEKLGVTLIHLMPILEPREGENDGGYAVKNYREIDPRIGNMKGFESLVKAFHKKGIRVCIDYVINHTASDHEWAQKALKGDATYQEYYMMFDDVKIPKAYEEALGQVFPKVAPGNFTYYEQVNKYVMTTFYPFQWDLNYKNPAVFHEIVDQLLFFANIGVDMIRLDAIPYIWKTLGTDCKNLPEVHVILSLFKDILSIYAPSTAILGEAIVTPEVIVRYFGNEAQVECDALYNASYMVEIWNSIATRDARHIAYMPQYNVPNESVWINYARCHDDIGWGLDEQKTRHLGFDPQSHKEFLFDFYSGTLKDSFAVGELYEYDPVTRDARNSGTLASLAGLEKALDHSDRYQTELAYKRIVLIHALFVLRKGIPMIYSGDEVAALNDYSYKENIEKQHDSRWLHRSKYDWVKSSPVTHQLLEVITLRKAVYSQCVVLKENVIPLGNKHVLAVLQTLLHETQPYILLYNLSEDRQFVYTADFKRVNLHGNWVDAFSNKSVSIEEETVLLGPYEFLLLKK